MDGGSYNPWSTDRCTANLRNAVLLAQRTGHFVRVVGDTDEHIPELPSMKQIHMQREISRLRKELNKVNLELQKKMQHHDTKDIIQVDIVEKKTEKLKDLSDHIQTVNLKKESLISRLQRPFVGEYLRLEAGYQKEACEVFHKIAPVLSGLASHIEDLIWMNHQDFANSQMEDLIAEVSTTLAAMYSSFKGIKDMARNISTLQCGDPSYAFDPPDDDEGTVEDHQNVSESVSED